MADQKTAVVTGAAGGLGKGFAEALLQKGYKVYFCDIDTVVAERTQKEFASKYGEGNIVFRSCDISKQEDLSAFFDEVITTSKNVDVMVNNAGLLDEKNWKRSIEVDYIGSISGTYLALENMQKSNGGRGGVIVNIASIAGIYGSAVCPVYCGSKHAIIGFTRSLAELQDIRGSGVRLVCLCPGQVNTGLVNQDYPQQFIDATIARDIMRKLETMSVDRVMEAFLRILEDDKNNGKAMIVTPNTMHYHDFPELSY